MSKTSAATKNKWNAKTYDRISLFVPKGEKEKIKAAAEERGQSVNGLISEAVKEYIKNFKA